MGDLTYEKDVLHEGVGTRGLVYWCWIVNDPVFIGWDQTTEQYFPMCPLCKWVDTDVRIEYAADGGIHAWQFSDGFMGEHTFRCLVGKSTILLKSDEAREVEREVCACGHGGES